MPKWRGKKIVCSFPRICPTGINMEKHFCNVMNTSVSIIMLFLYIESASVQKALLFIRIEFDISKSWIIYLNMNRLLSHSAPLLPWLLLTKPAIKASNMAMEQNISIGDLCENCIQKIKKALLEFRNFLAYIYYWYLNFLL